MFDTESLADQKESMHLLTGKTAEQKTLSTARNKWLAASLIPLLSLLFWCIYFQGDPINTTLSAPLDLQQKNVFSVVDERETAFDKDGNIMFLDRHNIDCGPIQEEALSG